MKYGVYANLTIKDALDVVHRCLAALEGEDIVLEATLATALGLEGEVLSQMEVDVLVTIGGDGTILRAMQWNGAPVLAINAGVLGFLTEVDKKDLEEDMARVRAGRYHIEKRSKLEIEVHGSRVADAMNEAVVHTANVAKIRHFRIYVDDQLASDLRADGIIVATPTGSTCYAMSAGAPIIDPKVEAFVIVPISPFKFSARPMVVPSGSVIRVEVVSDKQCVLVIDGQESHDVEGGRSVRFSLSDRPGRFIRFTDRFYERMCEKLIGAL